MILVFGDDSSDEKRERVAAVAAVAGTEEAWDWIEPQWVARNNGIPFHARDCESDQGNYKDFSHAQNKKLYRDLTTMMVFSELGGLGFGIDLVAQRKVFPHAPDMAYYKAFSEILEAVKSLSTQFAESAKFTFDISPENEYNAGLVYSMARNSDPDMFKYFDPEISFVPAKHSARVQVADLLAYEAMKALDHTVGPVKRRRGSWEALRATQRFETISWSEEWFLDLKKHLPQLEERMGFNQADYDSWLKEQKRQHNMSNLLYFSNLMVEKKRPGSRQ